MNYVLAGIVVLALAYDYISRVSVNKKYAEDLPGVYFLYEDGSPCFHFYESSDGKVWYYDFGRNFRQPAPYDNMEQLKKAIKPRIGGWKYKIIFAITVLCVLFSSSVYARSRDEYRQLADEYREVINKAEQARSLNELFDNKVNFELLNNKIPFIRMIFMWQMFNFMQHTTYLELTSQAPWMKNK